MTILTIERIDDALGVAFPPEVVVALNLQKGALMSAFVSNGSLVLTPISDRTAHLLERAEGLAHKHEEILKALTDD